MSSDPRHEAAHALLAHRSPGGYSEEEFLAAYEEVNASIRRDIMQRALVEVGAADPVVEIVTEDLLLARAHEVLYAKGFYQYDGGDSVRLPDDEEQLEAARQAIQELGKPGEKRRDLKELLASRRDVVIDSAIADGKIAGSERRMWESLYDDDPERVVGALAATPPHPEAVRAQKHGYSFDLDGFERDAAARTLLREAGLNDTNGKDSPDADDYEHALSAVDKAGAANVVALRDEARKAGYTGEAFLEHAENIAADVANRFSTSGAV